MDEEQKHLLRRVVENLARRQLASINILGHCLKYVGELDVKAMVASELDLSLRLFREVHGLYAGFGWGDLESAVRERVEEVPYPSSRLEFGVEYYVTGLAESVAMRSYVDSSCRSFAAIARTHVEAAARRPEPRRFMEYCGDETNRPQAQQFFDRWYRIALESFGRVGSSRDARAVQLGVRSRTSGEMMGEFRDRLGAFVGRCGLVFPEEVAEVE